MLAASMEDVATGLLRERVHQKTATLQVARNNLALGRFKIPARLLVIPVAGSGRKPLEPERRARRVANVAARMAWALGQERWAARES